MVTERIDVLAQLRTTYCPPECFNAVAELIEQAETAAKILHNVISAGQVGNGYAAHVLDLRAAIARVGGAK